jgi:UDP-2-acetamido-3-amino-2,3-dideoxy-glucuronate N-acetyltransferase
MASDAAGDRGQVAPGTERVREMDGVFIHESSYVDAGARIGKGSSIWHFSHIMSGAVIGERCNLGQNVVVMSRVRIGNNVKIQNNVSVYEGVVLDDDVFCGPSMVFTNVINPRSHVSRKHQYLTTHLQRGVTVGANATLVCGATLGEYSFVAAGAVITRDVLPFALMVGVPAKRIGWMCQCGERLPDSGDGACAACGSLYRSAGEGIERVLDSR